MSDHHRLDDEERSVLTEIQLIQSKLAQARHRLATSRNRRFHRHNANLLALPYSHDGVGGGVGGGAGARRPSGRHGGTTGHRVISVSLRLPRAAPHPLAQDSGLPPNAVFSLTDAAHCPFVWVGALDPSSSSTSATSAMPSRAHRHAPVMSSTARRRHPQPPLRYVHVALPKDPELMRRFHIFCEHILWRLLHYDYVSLDMPGLLAYWDAYRVVNHHFAEAVADICEDGDLIWVHNYHLMLLPALLRESLWYARIGFFLYTPFPSAELFRILPHRAEILHGVLGADVIGFHSYEYAKQFVASCRRLLGLEATPNEIVANPHTGRTCMVGIYPAGIDVEALNTLVSSKLVQVRVDELRARFDGVKLVVGIDRLDDRFAGIPHKLLAFERLLADNPQLVGHVVLVQVAMLPKSASGSSTGTSYRKQQMQLNELVGRINSNFGTWAYSPIHFINSRLDPSELHALMCVGHVCVVTTVRDGMGLIPHEWTVCQRGGYKGPIVLSEFAGAAQSFSTALHVNPWDIDEVAAKIKVALDMGDASRHVRSDVANRFVTSHTAKQWGGNFLDDLENVDSVAPHIASAVLPRLDVTAIVQAYLGNSLVASRASSSTVLSAPCIASLTSNRYSSLDLHHEELGNEMRLPLNPPSVINPLWPDNTVIPSTIPEEVPMSNGRCHAPLLRPAVSRISPDNASLMSSTGPRRASLFILDLDGTLIPFQATPEASGPPQHLLHVLNTLLDASPHNFVLITSSRDRQSLAQWFSGLRVFLAAEDGAFFRPPGAGSWSMLFRDSSSLDGGRRQSSGDTVQNTDLYTNIKMSIPSSVEVFGGASVSINPRVGIDLADMLSESLRKAGEEENKPKLADSRASEGNKKHSMSSLASVSTDNSQNSEPSAGVAWKAIVYPVMEHFAERTPGSFVEEGDATITWHYADAEPDFGQWQSRHLSKHLESFALHGLAISLVAEGGQWIRVKPKGVDKTKAVLETVKCVIKKPDGGKGDSDAVDKSEIPSVEFVFCVGDDRADEGMFELFKDKSRLEKAGIACSANRVFTCRVGTSRTAAAYCLQSSAEVLAVLEEMASKLVLSM